MDTINQDGIVIAPAISKKAGMKRFSFTWLDVDKLGMARKRQHHGHFCTEQAAREWAVLKAKALARAGTPFNNHDNPTPSTHVADLVPEAGAASQS